MRRSGFLVISLIILSTSCSYFYKQEDDLNPLARVNDNFLYPNDVAHLFTENISEEDSLIRLSNFINKWATEQLLVDGAKRNLNDEKLKRFDDLASQYKNDLYSNAYIEALVTRNIDTVVSWSVAENYFNENKEIFKLNEELIKFRYINIDENRFELPDLKTKFTRFNDEDKKELDSIAIQFKSYSLNDSIWIKVTQAIDKIPAITTENKNELLKKSNFIQLKDSLGLYLMQIEDVLERNSLAPLEYVKPTIDQIVINKRKLELIKELEKDIITDAIKNKQFEIFN
ncbi:peptidyl-prolyl cis-trans isomerase [Hanstruepera neustonica]|uniref:peptidyl-prolyl cis-trans isomerase n=1 Tax=Hanstruepera neustonica TaxID=1445657 RepID=UPI001A9C7AD3|nr:peptidyl-prolyl cis-trans isomerase [Hanstruepera neustonica]